MGLVTMTRSQHQYKDKFTGLYKYYMASNASIMEGESKIRIEGIKRHIVHKQGFFTSPIAIAGPCPVRCQLIRLIV